jgi:hypothetical protein
MAYELAQGPQVLQTRPLDFSGVDDFAKIISDYRKNQQTQSAIQALMGAGTPEQKQAALMQLAVDQPAIAALMWKREPTELQKAQTELDVARTKQIEHPTPKWGKVGADWAGNPIYGYPPAYGGGDAGDAGQPQAITPPSTSEATPPQAAPPKPDIAGLTGDDFLKASGLPPSVQERVRSIARGDQPPPSSGFGGKISQTIMNAVTQYDPTYTGTRWQTREAFGPKGKFAIAVQAMQTLPQHMRRLWSNNDKLGGIEAWFGPYARMRNAAEQYVARGGSSEKAETISAINADLQAVPEELERVWRGTGGNVTEIESWKRNFDLTASPSARKQMISELASLVLGRVQSLQSTYTQGMGSDRGVESIIPQGTEDILQDIAAGKTPEGEPGQAIRGEVNIPKSQSVVPGVTTVQPTERSVLTPGVSGDIPKDPRKRTAPQNAQLTAAARAAIDKAQSLGHDIRKQVMDRLKNEYGMDFNQ